MKAKRVTKYLMSFCVALLVVFGYSATAKAAVTQVVEGGTTDTTATITWPAEDKATAYHIYFGVDSASANAAAPIDLPATQLSYTFAGLQPGTEYYVKVTYDYLNYSGTASYTSSVGTLYDLATLPAKVTGVNQTKWWYYIGSVDFSWDQQSACHYEYVVKNSKGKKVKSETRAYKDGSCKVENNQVYSVKVRAYVELNGQKYYGAWSDPAYMFTQPMVKSAKVSKGKLTIKWGKVKGATKYTVYVSTKEKKGYKKVGTVSSKKGSLTVSKFKKKKFDTKKTYYIYIVASKKVDGVTYTSGRHYTYSIKKNSGKLNWTFDK